MDKTQQFKAAVMTLKVQTKIEFDKNRILKKSTSLSNDEFSKKAKEVCNKITTLRNVLIENRAAYMHFGRHLKSSAQMTDEQRDLIERESEKFFIFYTQYLAQMRADWKREKTSRQRHDHMDAIVDLLINYLKSVQQIYLDQKKYRVQYELESYRLLKLASDKSKIPARPGNVQVSGKAMKNRDNSAINSEDSDVDEINSKRSRTDLTTSNTENDWSDDWQWDEEKNEDEVAAGTKRGAKRHDSLSNASESQSNDSRLQISQKIAVDEDIEKSQQLLNDEVSKNLSPEDVQMFEQENAQMFLELQGLAEEVEQIEKNVVDIAQLQDIFTEKVSTQHHNIERIANAVVGATENVKDANEQIKQAIQRNAGLRVWSLFFLLVMSFSLLFLDWYYD